MRDDSEVRSIPLKYRGRTLLTEDVQKAAELTFEDVKKQYPDSGSSSRMAYLFTSQISDKSSFPAEDLAVACFAFFTSESEKWFYDHLDKIREERRNDSFY